MDEKFELWTNPDEDENGIDIERLRRNRAMTPEQRLEQHRRACESVLALRAAVASARLRKNLELEALKRLESEG